MPAVITTTALSRAFGPIKALDDLTLELPEGGTIGLVGPNGSGKSTLIRTLLGMLRPTSGSATVLGHSIAQPARYTAKVGVLIESPAFLGGLSARANLRSLARLRRLTDARVESVLELVGLADRSREPVRRYSLGMKQRLGIAAALLGDPDLLILDEPTNGLDPAGVVEIREVLRAAGSAGRTVIVSSHVLSEIEAICDHLVVIRYGVLLFAGPIARLRERTETHVDLDPEAAADRPRLAAVLRDRGWAVDELTTGLRVTAAAGDVAAISRAATDAGLTLVHLVAGTESLESIFLEMTGGDRDPASKTRRGDAAERAA